MIEFLKRLDLYNRRKRLVYQPFSTFLFEKFEKNVDKIIISA